MRSGKNVTLFLLTQATKKMVEDEKKGIVSICPTLFHQPKRPKRVKEK